MRLFSWDDLKLRIKVRHVNFLLLNRGFERKKSKMVSLPFTVLLPRFGVLCSITSQDLWILSHFLPSNTSFCYLHVCLWKSTFLPSELPRPSPLAQLLWLAVTYSPGFLQLCPRGDAHRPERTTKVQFGF